MSPRNSIHSEEISVRKLTDEQRQPVPKQSPRQDDKQEAQRQHKGEEDDRFEFVRRSERWIEVRPSASSSARADRSREKLTPDAESHSRLACRVRSQQVVDRSKPIPSE